MDKMDWRSCFICQAHKSNEKTVDPSLSIKLRNNPERLYACYKEVKDNIEELSELDELPDFVVLGKNCDGGGISHSSSSGGEGTQDACF